MPGPGKFVGIIAVADVIKEDSPQAVQELQNMGIRVVMLTGDNERTARAIGAQAGVDEVVAGVLPDGKESVIRALKEKGKVAMVGDGINDAPALTRADIGIAIGAGTDIAIDAADVVLMKSRLSDVPAAIRLSRATLKNIHENLFWAFFYNVIGIPLAAGVWIPLFGLKLNPMFGAAAMSLSSFCVVSNALRLNFFKMHNASKDKKIQSVDISDVTASLKTDAEAENSGDSGSEPTMMKTLEIEFSLYLPSLTDMQKAILKQTIIELYNQFGIFWETDIRQLKATDFPILSDLHALLEKKAEANKENPVYRDLAMLLYDAAAGSDSFLWNGHTTLEANSRFICLDTHDLQNASDNVKRTQYLNLLSWCWEEMSRDRNERCLLVCDEAYLMIDPQVPQSLVFLRNVEKRARKYEAGLAIISHSVVDFLAPEVKMYGQALLDIPCYKILMGCDGKNLQETKDLYNLTDAEQELLESKRRGHALFIIGSKRLHVNFEIPAYKFSYMGKAGGR